MKTFDRLRLVPNRPGDRHRGGPDQHRDMQLAFVRIATPTSVTSLVHDLFLSSAALMPWH
jgi:hypothetical protein